jgi:CRP-like cAMP-binding protein
MQDGRAPDPRQLKKHIRIYRKLLAVEPTGWVHHENLGRLLLMVGKRKDGLSHMERAAGGYARDGHLVDAIRVGKEILTIEPQRTAVAQFLAGLYAHSRVVTHAATAIATDPLDDIGGDGGMTQEIVDASALVAVHDVDELGAEVEMEVVGAAGLAHESVGETVTTELLDPDDFEIIDDLDDMVVESVELDHAHPDDSRVKKLLEITAGLDAESTADLAAEMAGDTMISINDLSDTDVISAIEVPGADNLPRVPLLSTLPRPAFVDVLHRADRHWVPTGADIVHEGEEGDALYLVLSGTVRVHKHDEVDGEPRDIELCRIGPGGFFGEVELLSGLRRRATVTACEAVELFIIDAVTINDLRRHYPELERTLERFYEQRLVANFLATSPLFHALSRVEREGLADRFYPITLRAGETLFNEGESPGGLYLLVRGTVGVEREGHLLSRIAGGDFIGVVSAITGETVTVSARAEGPTEVLCLDTLDLDDILTDRADVREAFGHVARARQLLCRSVVHGSSYH